MEDKFRTVRLQIIGDSKEEAQAALKVFEENLPVFASTAPQLNLEGKYVAEATTQVSIENVERLREIIRLEKLEELES